MSEFDTLRADLAAIRSDLETRMGGLRQDVDRLRTEMDLRFARVEAKIDEKPGAGVIYQASLAMMTGMFAVMIGTIILLKSLAYIP